MTSKLIILLLVLLLGFNLFFLNLLIRKGEINIIPLHPKKTVTSLNIPIPATSETLSLPVNPYAAETEAHLKRLTALTHLDNLPPGFPPEKFPYTIDLPAGSKIPQIPDSGKIVRCTHTTAQPQLDGFMDQVYGSPVILESKFFDNLRMAALYDQDNVFMFFSFSNNIPCEPYVSCLKWDERQKTYFLLSFTGYKYYNPYKYLFLDIYWEIGDHDLETCLSKRLPMGFDLWNWTPGTCISRNLDDNFCKATPTIEKKDLLMEKGRVQNSFPIYLNETYQLFGLNYHDSGDKSYKALDVIPLYYEGATINALMPAKATESSSDIECRWTFNGKVSNFPEVEKMKCIGEWTLEIKRRLDTGHPDDIAFNPGQRTRYRFFLPYLIPFYSEELKKEKIYHELLEQNLGQFIPFYTLEFVK
ncbi:MAG: hypothetical protein PHW04_11055 [Candidatus Wallbacteria bacterium]|nr:hypothetical protein [Candidatus Wallbacteria bacterium]